MAVTAVIVNRRVTPRADQLTHAVRRIWSFVPVHLTSPENNSTVSECGQNSSVAISNIRGGVSRRVECDFRQSGHRNNTTARLRFTRNVRLPISVLK